MLGEGFVMAKTAAQIFSDMHATVFGIHAEAITYNPFGASPIATTGYVHELSIDEQDTDRGKILKKTFRVDVLKSAVPTVKPNFDTVTYGALTIVIVAREHDESGKYVLRGEWQSDEELSNESIRRNDG